MILSKRLIALQQRFHKLLNIKYKEGRTSWDGVGPMCSLGIDSYFCQKGYFHKGQNLRKRLLMGTDMIKSRMKRYRSKLPSDN